MDQVFNFAALRSHQLSQTLTVVYLWRREGLHDHADPLVLPARLRVGRVEEAGVVLVVQSPVSLALDARDAPAWNSFTSVDHAGDARDNKIGPSDLILHT